MVVAHPDDESIFGSSLFQRFPGDWTVICCSIPQIDPERAEKFFDACATLGASALLIPVVEEDAKTRINQAALSALDNVLGDYDHIVTHNKWGEYGHEHHKNLHGHVAENYKGKKLTTFGYRAGNSGEHIVNLSGEEIEKKLTAIKCYNNRDIPYHITIMRWFHQLQNMKLAVETFDGDWFV